MKTSTQIENLWDKLQEFIDQAYKAGANKSDSESNALRDFTSNGWHHDLRNLAERETVNEKQHRRGAPAGFRSPISAPCAAKLLLCGNFAEGSHLHEMPPATNFIVLRKTAAEAMLLGYLCREFVTEEWRAKVQELDYAKIMAA